MILEMFKKIHIKYLQINQLEVFNINIQFSANYIFLVGEYTKNNKRQCKIFCCCHITSF